MHCPRPTSGSSQRLIVSAVRGSGGGLNHLAHVIPTLRELRPSWSIELHAPADVLRHAFGSADEPWMRPLADNGYGFRLRWEFLDLPSLLVRDDQAVVFAPFGPILNLNCASRAVWMSRNIMPLLDPMTWDVSDGDVARLLALRPVFVMQARAALATICVSQHARQRLAAFAGIPESRIAVVPHGTEQVSDEQVCRSEVARGIVGSGPFLLHVGQPCPGRRTLDLIDGYRLLAARRPDLPRLVIVGSARQEDLSYERTCRDHAQSLLSAGKLVILGSVPHDDVLVLTGAAHSIVYPSVYEDCPNVILEGLAAGKAIVCADIPANRELAADALILVKDPRPRGIADALEQIIANDAVRASYELRAAARGRSFTWERAARRTAEVLDRAFVVTSDGLEATGLADSALPSVGRV